MGVQVVFDPQLFLETFPQFEFVAVSSLVEMVLPLAEQYVRNDGGGPVSTVDTQVNLLNLCVAHLCQLFWGVNGAAPSTIAGQITSATQGSINVSVAAPSNPNAEWYYQTPFGAALWQAMAPYRTMRYISGRRRVRNPWVNQ